MTWEQVMSMLSQGDSVGTRFLKRFDSSDTLIISMVALANTLGGTIVIGLDKNNFQLTGSTLTEQHFKECLNHIFPHIDASFNQINRLNQSIHVIKVEMGLEKPYSYLDKTYRLDDRYPLAFRLIEELAPTRPSSHHSSYTLAPDDSTLDQANHMILSPVYPTNLHAFPSSNESDDGMSSDQIYVERIGDGSPIANESFLNVVNLDSLNSNTLHDTPTESPHDTGEVNESIEISPDVTHSVSQLSTHYSPAQPISNVVSFLDRLLSVDEVGMSVSKPSDIKPLTGIQLNQRQQQALDYMGQHYQIQNKKYRTLYAVSHKTAHLELTDMLNKGLIEVRGSGRSTHYILNS